MGELCVGYDREAFLCLHYGGEDMRLRKCCSRMDRVRYQSAYRTIGVLREIGRRTLGL